MKSHLISITAAAIIALAAHDLFAWVLPVQASETPPCEPIAHAGAVLLFRCEDPDSGQIIYANQMGMLILGEQ